MSQSHNGQIHDDFGREREISSRARPIRSPVCWRWRTPSYNVLMYIIRSDGQQPTPPLAARKIRKALEPALGYLTRLQRRMELTGFPPNDPLYLATRTAQRALESLLIDLHYRSCESGVGRSRRPYGLRCHRRGFPDQSASTDR
jgi:hypothetical protein